MLGYWLCIVLALFFAALALIFAFMREKAAILISGFNMMPKAEQDLYDKARMSKDMRNSLFLWAVIMLLGALGCYIIWPYCAFAAYGVWLVLFFKDVHLDAQKAFQKYKTDSESAVSGRAGSV